MKRDNSEVLEKTHLFWSANFDSARTRAYRAAFEIGLPAMLRSTSLWRFAEVITGFTLDPECGIQAVCYGEHDYVGPHNDHQPQIPEARDGYVDVQITFTNLAVAGQALVYERKGYLTECIDVGKSGAINVFHLPYWHYVTPHVANRRGSRRARRWVLLATFTIVRSES
jgi:hypothetical protein